MEADKLFLEEISDFLGPKKDRYFANGFKGIDISYHETTYQNGVFRAAIQVGSGNGWSKKKGENLTPHLGTTEFISIAAAVSQQLMERELQLSREAIECSWISRFTCKIKQCENIDCHHIPLSGSLFSTRVNEDNMYEYGFKVQIGSLLITLYVCSPRKFIPDKTDPSGKIDVYTTDMKRIALTGSPNRERTILANALSILAGFDRTLCPPYSQIAKKYDLSLDRSHCQWPDSYVYCLGAFTERVIVEQQYADHFVSERSETNGGFHGNNPRTVCYPYAVESETGTDFFVRVI
ncbi:hypothetical protein FACS1894123_02760 [Bacteroidia bacterium]|nr:hypothetical protein FACS1894123_02760 [Bacteroidia bacterium]